MGRLDGKVALITGAARGQGAAAARLFVAEGAGVVLADVLDDDGAALAEGLGPNASYRRLDVSREEDWRAAAAFVGERFGRLTTLVNNAGVLAFGALLDMPLADYRAVIDVNQIGCFLGMQVMGRLLVDSGGGSIVNISSTAGMVGLTGMVAYGASKFAIRGMTKVAAVELGRFGVRVNAVMPGSVNTQMLTATVGSELPPSAFAGTPLGRPAEPEEIARLVLFLASDEASYCTGHEFIADGGVLAGFVLPSAG